MNSFQESKNELEAAIRYAENAISSAQGTIESMEFRQEMAKKQYAEQTGREEALTKLVKELEEANEKLVVDNHNLEAEVKALKEANMSLVCDNDDLKDELFKLRKEKEASSGPCGCQAYRDLEEKATMPVIPRDVAIAIFREGTLFGVEAACDEIQGTCINISESDYVGDFSISFERDIDLDDHIDFDWVRSKIGDYDEGNVTANLEGLCAKNNFECRIHGIDDND